MKTNAQIKLSLAFLLTVVMLLITPQCMGDEIGVELYMGATTVDTLEGYSVKKYLDTIINGTYSAEAKQLAKDMLVYGAMAQVYRNYKTDSLVTNEQVRDVSFPTDSKVLNNSAETDAPKCFFSNRELRHHVRGVKRPLKRTGRT